MPFSTQLASPVIERLPGWYGRYFHSQNMTLAHYEFKRGSSIHEHLHPEEEVYEVVEGEIEVTIEAWHRSPDRVLWRSCPSTCATPLPLSPTAS